MTEPAAPVVGDAVVGNADHALMCVAALEAPRASLAHGAAGVAYYLYRHATLGGGETALQAAAEWAAEAAGAVHEPLAFTSLTGPLGSIAPRGLHYHEPGVWWVQALVALALGDEAQLKRSVTQVTSEAEQMRGNPGDVTSGSAGLLLGCAQLVETIADPDLLAPLRRAGAQLAADLAELADRHGAVPGERALGYLGAAHGWAGVAHALLRWSQATGAPPPDEALQLLERLIALRRKSGRWPIRAGSREVWRGWCHGSAGWAQTWSLAWQLSGDERFIALAEQCAHDAVSADGEESSLCCGRAGQGFAALTLYRATGEQSWLRAAHRVSDDAARTPPDGEPAHRLFSGRLGVALLATELEEPLRSAMPVYESIA